MKTTTLTALLFCLLAVPRLGYAIHHLVFVSSVVRVDAIDCAVELTISGDGQNAFTTDDNIKIDGNLLVDLTAVVDAGIDGTSGRHNTGDKILAGSGTFDASHGINADMVFEDSECSDFDSSAVVGFFINGDTAIDAIDTSSVSGFGDNTAAIKSGAGEAPTLVNLASATLVVGNNAGDTTTLGTSGAPTGGTGDDTGGDTSGTSANTGGGCSLIR